MASEFARLFRSALARRLAYVLVASVLAWLSISVPAHAQDYSLCYARTQSANVNEALCPTREVAYQEAVGHRADIIAAGANLEARDCWYTTANGRGKYECNYGVVGSQVRAGSAIRRFELANECPSGTTWNDETKKCEGPKDCASESDLGAGQYLASDSQICSGGCQFSGAGELCVGTTVDGQQAWYCSVWKPTGQTCSAGEGDTPTAPSDGDGDGSSDGNDTSPNNPGQGGGGSQDGSSNPSGGTGSGPNGGQGNGSGEGSGNGNTSGGGGNCASPPSSTGDAILAQIAYQTWATRCAIEGAKDGNGNLKTTQGDGSGSGNGNGNGQGDEGTDFGTSDPGEDEAFDPADVKRFGIPVNTNMLDSEAIFGGGTCPVLSVTIYGKTFSTSEIPSWCDLLRILRALVLIFAAFTALHILMGNNT